jgi:hypothetical protein
MAFCRRLADLELYIRSALYMEYHSATIPCDVYIYLAPLARLFSRSLIDLCAHHFDVLPIDYLNT